MDQYVFGVNDPWALRVLSPTHGMGPVGGGPDGFVVVVTEGDVVEVVDDDVVEVLEMPPGVRR